jgi:Uma2 family endonuclease
MVATEELKLYRFTINDLEPMVRAGIIDQDARVELFDGALIDMPPISLEHADVVDALIEAFTGAYAGLANVRSQGPIMLGVRSQLQPDLALLSTTRDRTHLPDADDIFLIIEVAVSSLAFDRGLKRRLYARAGIREYWVIDVASRVVEVSREPTGDAFRVMETYAPGDTIVTALGRAVAVSEFLT